jgi:4-hydroxy-3-polyprenylbenzoate decarboxylase
MAAEKPIVVGITGGSGAVYAVRLIDVLLSAGREVHLTISDAAVQVVKQELGVDVDLKAFDGSFLNAPLERLKYFHFQDWFAPMASGSFRTDGMVVVPCSGGTLAAVAGGHSSNLVQRAAEVHLKERRMLVLVTREAPLSLIAIENMAAATRGGAVVLPASPGFYYDPKSIYDLVDFVVARICDQLDVEHSLSKRWGEERPTAHE